MNMRVCGGGRCCLKGEEGVMCKRGIWVRREIGGGGRERVGG